MFLRAVDPLPAQRRRGQAGQASDLSNVVWTEPARYREDAVGRQRREKMVPSLGGVEPVFRERKGSRSGSSPGVDQAHFDQVKPLRPACEPATPLIDKKSYTR